MSLCAAAREVGMSRRALDEYFCLIRMGELYRFDF
jgi:hypothetical protein